MENRTQEQLEARATEIILQDGHTPEDTKELSRIRFFMSKHYKAVNMTGSAQEWAYNWIRANNQVEKIEKGVAVTRAEAEAKAEAESEYPNRREKNAEASGIQSILETTKSFIITLQIEQKVLDQVYTWQ